MVQEYGIGTHKLSKIRNFYNIYFFVVYVLNYNKRKFIYCVFEVNLHVHLVLIFGIECNFQIIEIMIFR